ncbi:hypothetical protein RJ55_05548 [Drechmeria coniospora]|nr:hypothetical protein RJ55_05548 [Drechmeria coniospora]
MCEQVGRHNGRLAAGARSLRAGAEFLPPSLLPGGIPMPHCPLPPVAMSSSFTQPPLDSSSASVRMKLRWHRVERSVTRPAAGLARCPRSHYESQPNGGARWVGRPPAAPTTLEGQGGLGGRVAGEGTTKHGGPG